jgi:hypothetical protein
MWRWRVERMSTLDAGFFFVEHRNVPMHLGSLVVFEGPADYRAAPDLDVLTKGIRRGLAELQAQSATRRTAPARRRARS